MRLLTHPPPLCLCPCPRRRRHHFQQAKSLALHLRRTSGDAGTGVEIRLSLLSVHYPPL
ncbi:unnamed protein product [Mesocestoides corti]|uniref:C2H2-type domain-containing protein n=1 Tax=Mesocestoides corti TaxID=53468 RepID=A0A0R3UCK9_MESCO|nr:unnamed protein product [Mesocestoides corti]